MGIGDAQSICVVNGIIHMIEPFRNSITKTPSYYTIDPNDDAPRGFLKFNGYKSMEPWSCLYIRCKEMLLMLVECYDLSNKHMGKELFERDGECKICGCCRCVWYKLLDNIILSK